MLLEKYPLFTKILSQWKDEPERPPLLLNGTEEEDWLWLGKEISTILSGQELPNDHPDIIFLERENKKINVEVDQVRKFIGKLSLSFFELPFKLGFIPEAHRLNVQSQNALLKTLEEPLKRRYLFLGTTSKNKLLPTILSRVSVVNIFKKTTSDLAISLENDTAILYRDCLESSPAQRLIKINDWSGGKTEKINVFFKTLIPILRKELLHSVKDNNAEKTLMLIRQLNKALEYSEQAQRTSGANPKLLFESFVLSL